MRWAVAFGVVAVVLGCANPLDTVRQEAARDVTHLQMMRAAQSIEIHALRSGAAPADVAALPQPLGSDGWDTPLIYLPPKGETAFDILSLGADKREGGEGLDADISYRRDVDSNDSP